MNDNRIMTSSKTPQDVLDAIEKLEDASDQVSIKTFIAKLKATIDEKDAEILTLKDGDSHAHYHGHEKCTASHDHSHVHEESHSHGHDDDIPEWKKKAMDLDPSAAPFGGSWTNEAQVNASDEEDFPPLYESGEDFDKATEHKTKASDFKIEEKWEEALSEYTLAVQAAPPSALLYANRATVLCELQQFKAAERDCNEALKENPDSAKALRVRGLARKELGLWEQARHDLSESQMIDFDQDTVEALKEVSHKVQEMEKEKVAQKLEKEAKLKKRAEEIKKAQEEAKRESARSTSSGMPSGGMPGMSGMGGAGGMGGLMEALMSDPELAAAMQNPKVTAAFSEMMQSPNPAKIQELMSDPEVGPVLQKLIAKVGPGMMAGGGMPGGGMGGGGSPDDIPDMGGDDNVDFDDLPDLE